MDEPRLEAAAPPDRYWSPLATLLLTAGLLLAFVVAQSLVLEGFALVAMLNGQAVTSESKAALAGNGFTIALATLASVPVVLGLIWLCVRLRRGAPAQDYLALGFDLRHQWKALLAWTAALMAFGFAGEYVGVWLGVPPVPEIMKKAYDTVGFVPLFYLAIVVAAPIFEEVLFRGFLWRGLIGAGTPLRLTLAILVTSGVWSVIHFQYFSQPFWLGLVFGTGILLGLARHFTGGITIPILVHALNNLIATLQLAYGSPR